MGKKQMGDMIEELLVAGLNNYKWDSLLMPQLLMIMRTISFMETVNEASQEYNTFFPFNRKSTLTTAGTSVKHCFKGGLWS